MAIVETVKVWKDGAFAVVNATDLEAWQANGWETAEQLKPKPKRTRKKA